MIIPQSNDEHKPVFFLVFFNALEGVILGMKTILEQNMEDVICQT